MDFEGGIDRRQFIATSASVVVAGALGGMALAEVTPPSSGGTNAGRIFKSVKWGMIAAGNSVREKFELCRELGYDGMELEAPSRHDVDEVLEAVQATGMPVHGTVGQKHWQVRLSSPDATTQDEARQDLLTGLADTAAYGGDSILLVPGQVNGANETHEDVWHRSIEQIRMVLPMASQLGVRILIENVWNGFCETPAQLRDYLDEINSPWVGAYFDIGNVQKFSPSEQWIRTLGPRIVKLDVKDWGQSNGFCKIGDGDVNWTAVREALAEIGFVGWCTAEVAGGDRERLADIARRMDTVLSL